jgi:hypothetical protein
MIRSIFSVLPIIFSIEVSSTTSDKPALIVNSSDPSDPLPHEGIWSTHARNCAQRVSGESRTEETYRKTRSTDQDVERGVRRGEKTT